jgi:hypothetical protein
MPGPTRYLPSRRRVLHLVLAGASLVSVHNPAVVVEEHGLRHDHVADVLACLIDPERGSDQDDRRGLGFGSGLDTTGCRTVGRECSHAHAHRDDTVGPHVAEPVVVTRAPWLCGETEAKLLRRPLEFLVLCPWASPSPARRRRRRCAPGDRTALHQARDAGPRRGRPRWAPSVALPQRGVAARGSRPDPVARWGCIIVQGGQRVDRRRLRFASIPITSLARPQRCANRHRFAIVLQLGRRSATWPIDVAYPRPGLSRGLSPTGPIPDRVVQAKPIDWAYPRPGLSRGLSPTGVVQAKPIDWRNDGRTDRWRRSPGT